MFSIEFCVASEELVLWSVFRVSSPACLFDELKDVLRVISQKLKEIQKDNLH